jgi:hypothetical protein
MALIKCGNCGKQISSKARSCPKCGTAQQAEQLPSGSQAASAGVAVLPPPPGEPKSSAVVENSVAPPASAAVLAAEFPLPAAEQPAPLDLQADDLVEEWYYVSRAGRQGPVSFAMLRKFLAAGEIEESTLIWNTGMPDWVPYSRYPEQLAASGALEELSGQSAPELRAFYIWALALAPLWGSIVQIFATEVLVAVTHTTLSYYAQLWWLPIVLNVLMSYLDYRNLPADGPEEIRTMDKWLFALVPWYIYRRDKALNATSRRLYVWIAGCLLSGLLFHYLNVMYVQVLAK